MDQQRLERALRQGPPFATRFVPRPLSLDDDARARRAAGAGRLVVLVAVTALLLAGMVASLAAVGGLLHDESPDARRPPIIEGLDSQAVMAGWIATSSRAVCDRTRAINATVGEWTCGMRGDDAEHDYEVVIVGESPSTVHSVEAWIARDDAGPVSPDQVAGFFALIVDRVQYSGSDTAAAQAWLVENQDVRAAELTISGVTYLLDGPDERRVLRIVPVPVAEGR